MAEIGLFLSSEEHGPKELVAQAQQGEAAGFRSVFISDHFHPWIDEQGESPFVWSVIGAIASTTELKVTTGVTCPILRIHPGIVAQAAATASFSSTGDSSWASGPGRRSTSTSWVTTGLRSPLASRCWRRRSPSCAQLWQGTLSNHRGRHYTVENARIYSCPDAPPPVVVSAFGPAALTRGGPYRQRAGHHPARRSDGG